MIPKDDPTKQVVRIEKSNQGIFLRSEILCNVENCVIEKIKSKKKLLGKKYANNKNNLRKIIAIVRLS